MAPLFRLLLTATLVVLGPAKAGAQGYPAKPIRIIVSTSPGGITDFAARVLGAHITARTGAAVVIDNRPGASGNIALEAVAHAAPDGYTLGFGNTGNITINPLLFANMPFDPLSDLVPVGPIGTVPLFLVINGRLPCYSLAEFIAYARAHPDTVNYAGAGAGTTPDLAGHEFIRRAGLQLVIVPFKGTTPATTAVVSGEVQATFISMGPHLDMVRSGSLRVLAAATPKREPYAPDIPTFAELGFPGFETSTWFSLFAPHGTPAEIIAQLNAFTRSVQADAEAKRRLDANFVDPLDLTASEFRALVSADAVKWERIVRETGVRPE
jgi:tripartite-type tricarboxylate transporter receptor subunit TctC